MSQRRRRNRMRARVTVLDLRLNLLLGLFVELDERRPGGEGARFLALDVARLLAERRALDAAEAARIVELPTLHSVLVH
jgi:hypothetical protein